VLPLNAYKWGRIGAGYAYSCAVTNDRKIKCWGGGSGGPVLLGDDMSISSSIPITVQGFNNDAVAVGLRGGFHTCAVTTSGGLKCWGGSTYLGNGSGKTSGLPVDVQGLSSGVFMVAAGPRHSCAITLNGSAKCWGENNMGQLGDGNRSNRSVPVDVQALGSPVSSVGIGADYSCVLTTAGAVKCWGGNDYGQLGNGGQVQSSLPVDVTGLGNGVSMVSSGAAHSCAVVTGNGVKCWGFGDLGRLGNGANTSSSIPVAVQGLGNDIVMVSCGTDHSCAVTTGGAVKCWGKGESGRLGDGRVSNSSVPVNVQGLDAGALSVATGGDHSCAVMATGAVKCWGKNQYGQLGNNSTTNSNVPVDVMGF
jgi:alpha-tubulin suppressor-like RCC1 family protein